MRTTSLLLLCFLGLPLHAASPEQAQCAVAPVETYTQAMAEWLNRLAGLIAERDPALAELGRLRTGEQVHELQQLRQRFRWLARHEPERLELGRGLLGTVDFEWTDLDERRLRIGEPEYAQLAVRSRQLGEQLARHPRRRSIEGLVDEELLASPGALAGMAPLGEAISRADLAVAACAAIQRRSGRSLTE